MGEVRNRELILLGTLPPPRMPGDDGVVAAAAAAVEKKILTATIVPLPGKPLARYRTPTKCTEPQAASSSITTQ
jgi:hypothetical protein